MLAVRGLAVARGGVTLLAGLDFGVPAGGALILRGANGSGKTTLLRTLAGLQPPVAGRVALPAEGVAYAAHADALKPVLTAAENLAFWAAVYGAGGDVALALAAVGLRDLARRPAGALSAGQKRRLGLARLIVAGRPLWLLDEPTVSLDAGAAAAFAALLAGHLARGGAAVVASHGEAGLPEAPELDLARFRAPPAGDGADDFAGVRA